MLITVQDIQRFWRLRPGKILHIGAHTAEEASQYAACGWGSELIVWVEADPTSAAKARAQVGGDSNSIVLEALAWDESGKTLDFHVTTNGESSSALTMSKHRIYYPEIQVTHSITMETTALGELPLIQTSAPFNLINLDIQGAELRALQGLSQVVRAADAVYSEVNREDLYAGGTRFDDLDCYLRENGFALVDVQMTSHGWGDALWLTADQVPSKVKLRSTLRKASNFTRRVKRRVRVPFIKSGVPTA